MNPEAAEIFYEAKGEPAGEGATCQYYIGQPVVTDRYVSNGSGEGLHQTFS